MSAFAKLVVKELARARFKHPTPQQSAHEGYGVMLEEVDEVWTNVKRDSSLEEMVAELVQVAAMAQRFAEDVCGSVL